MNIAKQKEIIDLRKEVNALQEEYQALEKKVVEENTALLLDSGIKEFVEYVENEGFVINGDPSAISYFTAEYESMSITVDRKERIFSVHMPNGERYSVSVEKNTGYTPYKEKSSMSQNLELETLQNQIEEVKKLIESVHHTKFKYVLGTESIEYNGLQFDHIVFDKFSEVLEKMFS